MGRVKGIKLSEEAKASMRAKREAHKLGENKGSVFINIMSNLKFLSFEELEKLIGLAELQKLKKVDDEKKRLIKEKQMIESQLQKLQEIEDSKETEKAW
jgi:conjugal transfer/entry exclusion protein